MKFGGLIAAIFWANPESSGVLLGSPSIIEGGALRLLTEAGVANRCEVVGGDMFTYGLWCE